MERKKLVAPNIDFADSKFNSFELTKEGHLFIHLNSWSEKRLKIIFTNTIRFAFQPGSIISDVWEAEEESTFLKEAIKHVYETQPTMHSYKQFVVNDIENFDFIQVVAEKAIVIANWTLLIIDNYKPILAKEIKYIVATLKNIVTINYVVVNGSIQLNNLINSTNEKSTNFHIYDEPVFRENKVEFLINKNNTILEVSKFLELIPDDIHLAEGNFFFEYDLPDPKNWDNPQNNEISKIIQTVTTVRVVDSQYIYIYTPYQVVENMIKEKYKTKSIQYDWLENSNITE